MKNRLEGSTWKVDARGDNKLMYIVKLVWWEKEKLEHEKVVKWRQLFSLSRRKLC